MKSWIRHFILGVVIGIITIIMMYTVLDSVSGYNEDSNLLVTLFFVLSYGVGTAVLGENFMIFDRKKNSQHLAKHYFLNQPDKIRMVQKREFE